MLSLVLKSVGQRLELRCYHQTMLLFKGITGHFRPYISNTYVHTCFFLRKLKNVTVVQIVFSISRPLCWLFEFVWQSRSLILHLIFSLLPVPVTLRTSLSVFCSSSPCRPLVLFLFPVSPVLLSYPRTADVSLTAKYSLSVESQSRFHLIQIILGILFFCSAKRGTVIPNVRRCK